MEELQGFFKGLIKAKLVIPLTASYFFMAFIGVIAESNKDMSLILMTKPFLMPLMLMMYVCASKKYNTLFIVSLFAVWIANMFLISEAMEMILTGSICFLIYRIAVILMVLKITKFPGYLPMVIGSLPFLILYLFAAHITYQEPGERFVLFVVQGIFMIFFGGFCLGSYILKSNKTNTLLLISALLFTTAQFLIVLKVFNISHAIFQPLTMLSFVIGQYLLYQYVLMEEKRKRRYKSA